LDLSERTELHPCPIKKQFLIPDEHWLMNTYYLVRLYSQVQPVGVYDLQMMEK
jgi:hypothetical protein